MPRRVTGVAVAIVFIAMAGAFLLARMLGPSDGARLEPGTPVWYSDGVTVTTLVEQSGGLRTGDRVIAIAGESLTVWADQVLNPAAPRPRWQVGDIVPYTVLRDGQRIELRVQLIPYPLPAVLARSWSTLLFILVTALVFTIVFMLRPRERAAWALFLLAWSSVHIYTWSFGLQVGDIVHPGTFYLYQLTTSGAWFISWSTLVLFALVFPQTHSLLNRPRLLWLVYGLPFLFFAVFLVASRILSGSSVEWMGSWLVGNWVVAFVALVLTIGFLIHGYLKRWDYTARRKVRWLLFGFILSGGIMLVLWVGPGILFGQPLISASALGLLLIPLPLVVAIAVWRDHLFDIDIIIRRTVTYSIVIVLLALVYFVSIFVLQQVFATVSNQRSELVTVLSTLVIAGLFVPLRNRIQNALDRRFYRKKYDAQQVLAKFAETVRNETDLNKLTAELLTVVNETMQPTSASLWLKKDKADKSILPNAGRVHDGQASGVKI